MEEPSERCHVRRTDLPLLALKVEKAGHELENEGQPLRAKKGEADTALEPLDQNPALLTP